jgi:homoserine O-acetyltransferase
MQDEYGQMTSDGHTYVHPTPFVLENGQVLEQAQLRYQTYGTLNANRDNVLVVCHALTGNASLHAWWGDMLGSGKAFDTDQYFVVCCNILGSCYGSTSPTSINPQTGQRYGLDFPDVSVKDTVRLQLNMLVNSLHLRQVHCIIGGSFGGMQALEFAVQAGSRGEWAEFPASSQAEPFVKSAIVIACGATHTAWQIGLSEVQRQAIYADMNWPLNAWEATQGLAIARQIGMVSYRTPQGYRNHFGRNKMPPAKPTKKQQEKEIQEHSPAYGKDTKWCVKSYLEYQGQKFLPRFDPITYVKMTEQMDSHDLSRGRTEIEGDVATVLSRVDIPILVMGIDSDVLYPLEEQKEIAEHLPNGELCVIHSEDGHDGFLLEQDQMASHVINFLDQRRQDEGEAKKRRDTKSAAVAERTAGVFVTAK